MANLESKIRMSALQFAIVLAVDSFGFQIISATNPITTAAGEAAWISVIVAGGIYLVAALLMVKLGEYFPNETFVEYIPRLWGKKVGLAIISMVIFLVGAGFCLNLGGFSQVITLFMFDRTPVEVIALSMLVLCVYGTLQDWGTILRYLQILFILETSITLFIFSLTFFDFNALNLLPIWPNNLPGVAAGAWTAGVLFAGYEFILLAFPFIQRGAISINKSVVLSFTYLILIYVFATVLALGSLSAEGIKNSPFPTFIMIRGIELPGTFVERLENYLLLAWTPVVFDSLVLMLFLMSHTAARYLGHKDHRPIVLLLAPLLFAGTMQLDRPQDYTLLGEIDRILLTGLSFVIVPLSLAMVWWRRKGVANNAQS